MFFNYIFNETSRPFLSLHCYNVSKVLTNERKYKEVLPRRPAGPVAVSGIRMSRQKPFIRICLRQHLIMFNLRYLNDNRRPDSLLCKLNKTNKVRPVSSTQNINLEHFIA